MHSRLQRDYCTDHHHDEDDDDDDDEEDDDDEDDDDDYARSTADKGRGPKKKYVFLMVFCQTPPRTPPPVWSFYG